MLDQASRPTMSYGLSDETILELTQALELYQHDIIHRIVTSSHAADIAHYMHIAPPENVKKLVLHIADYMNPEILLSLERIIRDAVVYQLGVARSADIIQLLDSDDALYVIQSLSQETQESILNQMPSDKRLTIAEGLSYPENSAGRMMQKESVTVMEHWKVAQIMDFLYQNPDLPDDFYEIFVIDQRHVPVGSIAASHLMRQPRHKSASEIMQTDLYKIETNLDQEEVSYLFTQYELTAAPVVNKHGRLVGVITVDDIVEVIEEEAEEDILRLGGISQTDIHASYFNAARQRFPWLLLNLFVAMLASQVISAFQDTLQEMVVLAAILPIVASMGGNAGTQTLTVAVRAIATKELTHNNAFRVVIKEISACGLNSLLLSIVGGLIIFLLYHNYMLSLIFAGAIVVNFIIAGLIGTITPILLDRFGADPAISSSIFLTALTDTIGFFSFLLLAHLCL